MPSLYWGDIDTHGLTNLERARRTLPGLRSVLMDEENLHAFKDLAVQEPAQHVESELLEMAPTELGLFAGLRAGTWGTKLRLEQERIPWAHAVQVLEGMLGSRLLRSQRQAANRPSKRLPRKTRSDLTAAGGKKVLQVAVDARDAMNAEKSVGSTFRVTPRTKRLLVAAAEREQRSLTNMFEVLVAEFCQRVGIVEVETKSAPKRAASSGKKPHE